MSQDHQSLIRRQAKRYEILRKIYDYTGGSGSRLVSFHDSAVEQWAAPGEVDDILDYLTAEGLLDAVADRLVRISHRGIVEVEQSIAHPDSSTDHFLSQVIQHFHAPVGAVQNAPNSTANVNQNIGANVADVLAHINELRDQFRGLPPERRDDALQLVDGLEAEAKTEGRSVARLKAMFAALMPFVTEVGANVAAAAIAKGLGL